jgi:hypothetical protein
VLISKTSDGQWVEGNQGSVERVRERYRAELTSIYKRQKALKRKSARLRKQAKNPKIATNLRGQAQRELERAGREHHENQNRIVALRRFIKAVS